MAGCVRDHSERAAGLTDSAALVLSQLKSKNSGNYWALLESLFDRKLSRPVLLSNVSDTSLQRLTALTPAV
jgi:hypothetical protein